MQTLTRTKHSFSRKAKSTHPHSPKRKGSWTKPNHYQKGKPKTTNSRRDPFYHVRETFQSQSYGELLMTSHRKLSLLKDNLPLFDKLGLLPDVWDDNTSLDICYSHVINGLQRIQSEHPIHINDKNQLNWLYQHQDCHDYGNLVPCDFLPRLSRKNHVAYKLTMAFLSFANDQLNIPLWNQYDEEVAIEQLTLQLEDNHESGEYDEDDASAISNVICYYNRYVNKHYLRSIFNLKTTAEDLHIQLSNYRPYKTKYKDLKDWIAEGLDLYRNGFNYLDYVKNENTGLLQVDGHKIEPHEYCRFVWDTDDDIGTHIVSRVDSYFWEVGCIPFTTSVPLQSKTIDKSHISIQLISQYYAWMNNAYSVFKPLYT